MYRLESWGRYPRVTQSYAVPFWNSDIDLSKISSKVLPYGLGRSYGDVCLNDGGHLLVTSSLNRIISFDAEQGLIRCEAGISLEQMLDVIVPFGWFLPVTPGTKFVTLGGAIANDVHGKNHHSMGTFGAHVTAIELLRSNGEKLSCSPSENIDLFKATIGGLGLTGLILSVECRLQPISSALIDSDNIKFKNLDEFFEVSASSEQDYQYTVAWLDCVSTGKNFGRGIFMRGNHSKGVLPMPHKVFRKARLRVPLDFPSFALNKYSVKCFNALYYGRQRSDRVSRKEHFDPFFYPLDSILNWNRIYGRKGFFQFQCVLPKDGGVASMKELLSKVVGSGQASFLAVLKEFGNKTSPGMLSFPRPGITLALDFPNRGISTMRFLAGLDEFVRSKGGAIYPAKDATMSPDNFKSYFPRWTDFREYVDPKFSSSLWRRVLGE